MEAKIIRKTKNGGFLDIFGDEVEYTFATSESWIRGGLPYPTMNLIKENGEKLKVSFTIRPLVYKKNGKEFGTGVELIQLAGGYTEDDMCRLSHGYSLRTKMFIDNMLKNIGYLGDIINDCGEITQNGKKIEVVFEDAETLIHGFEGRASTLKINGNYAIEVFSREVDSVGAVYHLFNQQVGMKEFEILQFIDRLPEILESGEMVEEDGKKIHWTELKDISYLQSR